LRCQIPESFRDFAVLTAVTQLAVIATPALLMAVMLTRSPAQTLLLRRPPLLALLGAGLLAFTLHPAVNLLQSIVMRVYPISEQMAELLQSIKLTDDNLWLTLLVVAALPAICEELAFRGFILSGLRHMGHKWTAIIISSVFFGAAHAIFQQSLIACLMGMIIGFIAVQTGSLLPGVLFHIIHNSMALLVQQFAPALRTEHAWLGWLMHDASDEGSLYAWPVVAVSLIVSGALLYWFHKLPYAHSPEESLQEAIEHQSAHWLPG